MSIKKPFKKPSNQIENQKFKKQKLHQAYYLAADVLAELNQKSCSINSTMYRFVGNKFIKMIYALAIKVLKNHHIIKEILQSKDDQIKMNSVDSDLNYYLVEILVAELLFGEKSFFKYRSRDEVKYVIDNQKSIEKLFEILENKRLENKDQSINNHLIRYIRINFLKSSDKSEIFQKIQSIGFTQKTFKLEEMTFDQFKTFAQTLMDNEFMEDYHFQDVLLFTDNATKTLTDSLLYKNGLISIQDKSSLLAIEAMQLTPGLVIMDAFAAPGMKTMAIASRLNNQCTLYANDRNKNRLNEMKELMKRSGGKFKVLNEDFTKIDPSKYPDLDILLLDPSCSGSGINRRLDYNPASRHQIDQDRCNKLAKFQLLILKSAIEFNAKRIVYCTCSTFQEENEDVINSLLETVPDLNYHIVDSMPKWPCRGIGSYEFSKQCLRANYEQTLTNGFFCCVFERNDSNIEKFNQKKTESIVFSNENVILVDKSIGDTSTKFEKKFGRNEKIKKKQKKRKLKNHFEISEMILTDEPSISISEHQEMSNGNGLKKRKILNSEDK